MRAIRSEAIPLTTDYVGLHDSLLWQPIASWMGQRDLIVGILQCMTLAHVSTLYGTAFSLVWANSIPM